MKKIIIPLIFVLILSGAVSAFGPSTHFFIFSKGIDEFQASGEPSLIMDIINENLDGCYSGIEYPDVGIFDYFTNFKDYKNLHSYSTTNELLRLAKDDRDRAFAYCWKIHLAEDAISHNYMIPAEIQKTKLPNYIIHAIKELKVEGFYLNPVANRLMERHSEFDELAQKATGRDWSSQASKLNFIMGGGNFYVKGYTHEDATTMQRLQNWLYKILAKFVDYKSAIDYQDLAVESTKNVLRGETEINLDPSGESALKDADSSTQLILYIVSIGVMGTLYVVAWRKRWI